MFTCIDFCLNLFVTVLYLNSIMFLCCVVDHLVLFRSLNYVTPTVLLTDERDSGCVNLVPLKTFSYSRLVPKIFIHNINKQ